MDWFQIKHSVTVWTGLHMDALHVHVGVLSQLLVAAIMRRSLASPWPWLALFAALVANEWFDLAYETWPNRGDQWSESFKDGWNTMLLPTVLMFLSRYVPGLLARPAIPPAPAVEGEATDAA